MSPNWANDRVRVRIFDVGTKLARQVALERLTRAERLTLVGVPARYTAVLRNGSDVPLDDLEATRPDRRFGQTEPVALCSPPAVRANRSTDHADSALSRAAACTPVSCGSPTTTCPETTSAGMSWTCVRKSLHIVLVDGEPSSRAAPRRSGFPGSLALFACDRRIER